MSSPPSILARATAFAKRHFLPLGLVTAATVAMAFPAPGREVASQVAVVGGDEYKAVSSALIFAIFLSSGFALKTDDLRAAFSCARAVVAGLVSILCVTPCLGFAAAALPLTPSAFASGLAVFCCVPTTLSSGVALVTQGGGNAALALILTVGSNLLGILTVPFALDLVLADTDGVRLDALALVFKLAATILGPLLIGKALREAHPACGAFAKAHKPALSLFNNGCLVLIVWQTLSKAQSQVADQRATDLLLTAAAGLGIHAVYLAFNGAMVASLGLREKERKAVLICTSQKTLPIAVTVINFLPEKYDGYHGMLTVPCVLSHLVQVSTRRTRNQAHVRTCARQRMHQ